MSCRSGIPADPFITACSATRYRKDKLGRCRELLGMSKLEPKADEGADKDYRDTYEELQQASPLSVPCLPPLPYGAFPLSSADHLASTYHRVVLTTLPPSRLCVMLRCLFDFRQWYYGEP